jgi:hypothetical protein
MVFGFPISREVAGFASPNQIFFCVTTSPNIQLIYGINISIVTSNNIADRVQYMYCYQHDEL